MEPVHLAFLWHQHQPFYKNLITGRYLLPWVRLHAIKDYIGMLLVLKEFPKIKATINLVPSLLLQIEEYAAGRAEDDALRLTRKPAEELDEADRRYILENLFLCNAKRLIRPFRRFSELFDLRSALLEKPRRMSERLNPAALRDIQVWGTLAWFHPLVVENDPVLKALYEKGRDFTEDDKAAMIERQDAVIRQVIPLHKELADAGRIETSTTPFYHPILPLLCNMESAREAMPDLPMPERRSDMRLDAAVQLRRAVEHHTRIFGKPPTGMWPAEGAVSADIVPLLQSCGIRWIATDEGILANSRAISLHRDGGGDLKAPDDLYQPYRLPGEGETPAIVFRDRVLSDAVGFEYHHGRPAKGAKHFVQRLRKLAGRCRNRPRLIPIILDGENPWDHYENAGLTFLRELYGRLADDDVLITTRLTDYLDAHPPERKLERLFAGSWIDSNFGVWIGCVQDRAAWNMVAEAREAVLRKFGPPGENDSEAARLAWEEIYITEGSDWYWWFGEDRNSDQDYMFDALFRAHLCNVYVHLGEPIPSRLEEPVGGRKRTAPWSAPRGVLRITLDGRSTTEDEWTAAGHYSVVREASAMRRSGEEMIKEVFFGFGREQFFLRLDGSMWQTGSADEKTQIALRFQKPCAMRVVTDWLVQGAPTGRILNDEGRELQRLNTVAVEDIFELGCPLSRLAAGPGDNIEFLVEVIRDGDLVQRIPRDGVIVADLPASE